MGDTNLHIGGEERRPGWINLNIQPGPAVDIVGNCLDLGMFDNGSCAVVYASHVLEHVPLDDAKKALKEIHRVLRPDGQLLLSVPDVSTVMRLFQRCADPESMFVLMRVIFGGDMDEFDRHRFGYNREMMAYLLGQAGFTKMDVLDKLGVFNDASEIVVGGVLISLNVVATK